jgi:hypothetical protein
MSRAWRAVAIAVFGVVALAGPAAAVAMPAPAAHQVVVATAPTPIVFQVDTATVVQFLIAVVLPLLVGLVTTRATSAALKSILLAALTLVTALLTEWGRALADGTTYNVGAALFVALPAFAISVGLHLGIYKPTGLSGAAQDVGASSAPTSSASSPSA